MPETNCLWGDSVWIDVCMLYESLSFYSIPCGGYFFHPYSGLCRIDSRFNETHFFNSYIWVALLSVLGAASIKVKSVPSGDIWIGFGLMQAAGIAFAFGQVAYRNWKKANTQVPDQAVFGLLALGGFICVGGFSLLVTDFAAVEITLNQWQSILYLGCVASGLGFFLWNKGATSSNPGTLAAFNNAVVPLAVIISLLVFGESEALDLENSLRLFVDQL